MYNKEGGNNLKTDRLEYKFFLNLDNICLFSFEQESCY